MNEFVKDLWMNGRNAFVESNREQIKPLKVLSRIPASCIQCLKDMMQQFDGVKGLVEGGLDAQLV